MLAIVAWRGNRQGCAKEDVDIRAERVCCISTPPLKEKKTNRGKRGKAGPYRCVFEKKKLK